MRKTFNRWMIAISIILAFGFSAVVAQNLNEIGSIELSPVLNTFDMKLSDNYAYLGGTGSSAKFMVVDISNPVNPVMAGMLNLEGSIIAFDVSGNYIFTLIDTDPRIRVIDVSDPSNPNIAGTAAGSSMPIDVAIKGNYAYVNDGGANITIYDISNPANPIFFALIPCPGIGPGSIFIEDNYLYIGKETRIIVFDITNPADIESITTIQTEAGVADIYSQNPLLFVSFGNFEEGYSKTNIYNIANHTDPQLVGFSPMAGNSINVNGSYIFINRYSHSHIPSSIDVMEISNPDTPLWAAYEPILRPSITKKVFARNDTVFVGGWSFFTIYKMEGMVKGALEGVVRDSFNGAPIEGAMVSLVEDNFTDTTDSFGRFFFGGIYDLDYSLSICHPDYYAKTDTGFLVIGNDTTDYTIDLGRNPWIDVGAWRISSPPAVVHLDSTYALISNAVNHGINPQSFGVVTEVYLLNSPTPILIDTATVDLLPPHSYGQVVMPESLLVLSDTVFKLISYTILQDDENHSNDTTVYYFSSGIPQFEVWYGNLDGSPLMATIGDQIKIDVYAKTRPDVYVGDLCLCLGTNDLFIDSLMSGQLGSFHSTILQWDDYSYLTPSHSPPNPPGWSTETFLGFSDLGGMPNPWLHPLVPTKILTMAMRASSDTSLCGDTVTAYGPGFGQLGIWVAHSSAGDTVGGPGYQIREHFSQIIFMPPCNYVLGDINGDGHPIGGDVTYAVRYFKSQGPPPVDSCYMDSTGSWFYPAGDVNGNCEFRGSDITRMVAYFKSAASLSYCHFFPPVETGR